MRAIGTPGGTADPSASSRSTPIHSDCTSRSAGSARSASPADGATIATSIEAGSNASSTVWTGVPGSAAASAGTHSDASSDPGRNRIAIFGKTITVAVGFDKARRVRSFDDVVEQLREAIYSGRIRPGQRLPGERQLCEAFGVGRPTLREALRSLEAVGLIEVRPGKAGGSYAVTPDESTVGDALAALVNLRGASLEDLAEFRVDFEGENAAWAARRADAGDIAALEAIVAEARAAAADPATLPRVAAIDVRWHEALARATSNRL